LSQGNLRLFLDAVATDESLRAGLTALPITDRQLDESTRDAIWTTHIIPWAKSKGFDFSIEDVQEYQRAKPDKRLRIPDEELDAVVGGEPCRCVLGGYGAPPEGWGACNCTFTGSGLTALGEERCGCLVYGFGYDAAQEGELRTR